MRALLLVVGLYRVPYAWEASRALLFKHNQEFQWETLLVIDRTPFCRHNHTQVQIVNATSFLNRLKHAYALVNWSKYDRAVVIRPDVLLQRPIIVQKHCNSQATTYVISGNIHRYYIFHVRDWDFGYLVCNKGLFYYVTVNNLTTSELPKLPDGFRGCWGSSCKHEWRYPYMENVIRRHNEVGAQLRNLDAEGIFLHLQRKQPHNCHYTDQRRPTTLVSNSSKKSRDSSAIRRVHSTTRTSPSYKRHQRNATRFIGTR